jgi:UDP-glucose:(heptosyl)LPS alpha-1,3-glucosyltransferase
VGHGDIQDQDVLILHNCVFYASELIHQKPLPAEHEMALTHGPLLSNHRFKKMVANSCLMMEDTIKRFKVPREKIEVIYPAVNTEVFHPLSADQRQKNRERFGFGSKIVVALVTSGDFKKRGLDLFDQAAQSLPAELLERIELRVVGKDKHSISNPRISFESEIMDIENYFNAIDVFVLPARIEEFGRVVLEAMACGLPVITTDKVGASELIEGEAREFVIRSHDAGALAAAIVRLVQDEALRERIGKLNAGAALKESEDRVFGKFDRVFLAGL